MYYWHAIFYDKGQEYEHNFWADSYDDAKVWLQRLHGAGINITKLERIN